MALIFGPLIAFLLFLRYPIEVVFSYGLAGITILAFSQAVTMPTYSANVLRESIRRGWMAPDDEYYAELARYLESQGRNGYQPADIPWGVAYWAIYYSMMGLGVLFTLEFLPSLRDWTPYAFAALDFSVAFACFVVYGRRATRYMREAEAKGFPLLSLYRNRSDVRRGGTAGRW